MLVAQIIAKSCWFTGWSSTTVLRLSAVASAGLAAKLPLLRAGSATFGSFGPIVKFDWIGKQPAS